MKTAIIILAAAFAAGEAPALAQTEFNCRTSAAGAVNCEESMESKGRRANEAMLRRMRERREAGEPASIGTVGILGMIAKKKDDNWRKGVSDAVLAGDCDGARRIALEHGDMTAAEQAMRLCER